MERLTLGQAIYCLGKLQDGGLTVSRGDDGTQYLRLGAEDCRQLLRWLEEYREYKQLSKDGRVIKIGCRIGKTVWVAGAGGACPYTVTGFSPGKADNGDLPCVENTYRIRNFNGSRVGKFTEGEIGRTVFLTREEAETKLGEMGGSDGR